MRFFASKLPRFVATVVFAVLTFNLRANDLSTAFDTANQLYVTGRYADAASAYAAMLQTGNISPAILFNYGNARFKQGKLGEAVAAYRQARLLAPRDADLRANLQLARTRARGGAPYRDDRWRNWLGSLSLNEWTALTALALWIFFMLLTVTQWRSELAVNLRKYLFATGAASLLLVICLGIELNAEYFAHSAIVTAGEADVRNSPFDEAPSNYKVRDGVELNILDQKDNWLQVVDPAQRTGWLRRDQVLLFRPTALPAPKPDGAVNRNNILFPVAPT